jgi:hypothetical protein
LHGAVPGTHETHRIAGTSRSPATAANLTAPSGLRLAVTDPLFMRSVYRHWNSARSINSGGKTWGKSRRRLQRDPQCSPLDPRGDRYFKDSRRGSNFGSASARVDQSRPRRRSPVPAEIVRQRQAFRCRELGIARTGAGSIASSSNVPPNSNRTRPGRLFPWAAPLGRRTLRTVHDDATRSARQQTGTEPGVDLGPASGGRHPWGKGVARVPPGPLRC